MSERAEAATIRSEAPAVMGRVFVLVVAVIDHFDNRSGR